MELLLQAAPLRPGRTEAYRAWAQEVRRRREDHERSRWAKGIRREVHWLLPLPEADLALALREVKDVDAALEGLRDDDDHYDRWYRERVADLLGPDVAAGRAPRAELLFDRRRTEGPPPLIVQYLAMPIRLLPGRAERLRADVRRGDRHGDHVEAYLEMLGLERLATWLQPTTLGDFVIFYSEGDVAQAAEVLATSDHPWFRADRASVAESCGLDLTVDTFPVPMPTFAWTASA